MAGLIKRGKIYYIQWYGGKKEKRRSLRTGAGRTGGGLDVRSELRQASEGGGLLTGHPGRPNHASQPRYSHSLNAWPMPHGY